MSDYKDHQEDLISTAQETMDVLENYVKVTTNKELITLVDGVSFVNARAIGMFAQAMMSAGEETPIGECLDEPYVRACYTLTNLVLRAQAAEELASL